MPGVLGGYQGLPFTTTSTDCTPWPLDPLVAASDSVESSWAETCCMTSVPALPMAAPVRLTTAVTPSSVTSLTLVFGGKAVFVAPKESQSVGGEISSLTRPPSSAWVEITGT